LWNVIRIESTCTSETTFNAKPEGSGDGRPKPGRLDDVETDVETLVVKKNIKTKSSRQRRMDGNSKEG
jgi:hypothetical protein